MVVISGTSGCYALHPDRLEKKREQIRAWLLALPSHFQEKGGGWTGNALCQANGHKWTESFKTAEMLLMMGMGLDMVERVELPEQMWPNGLPFYRIKIEKTVD